MITQQDCIDAAKKKFLNEILKADIRRNYAPVIAENLCARIDAQERTEHLTKCFNELMNSYIQYQIQQQQYLDALYKSLYGNN